MSCKCNCIGGELPSIPFGNDFRLLVCGLNIVPGDPDASFADIEDMAVVIRRFGVSTPIVPEIVNGTDLLFRIPASMQKCGVFGIEITGTYGGKAWRWKANEVYRIVEENSEGSEPGGETFADEIYYVWDSLEVEAIDDTMYFYTHGHAQINDGTLMLQGTEHTELEVKGETLIFTVDYN